MRAIGWHPLYKEEKCQFMRLCKNEGKALKLLLAFTDVDIEGGLVPILLHLRRHKTSKKVQRISFSETHRGRGSPGRTDRAKGGGMRRRRIGARARADR